MAKRTNYFPHDHNARHDHKLVKLRLSLGMSGVGIYWCLVEMLYERGGKIRLNDVELIAKDWREKRMRIEKVIRMFELFEWNNEFFWSNAVNIRLEKIIEKSVKASQSANIRHGNDANALRTDSEQDANALLSKAKTKEKEKLNTNKEVKEKFTPPSEIEVINFFKEKGFPEALAKRAFEYYDTGEWKDREGVKIKNWKQKMLSTWLKPENKENESRNRINNPGLRSTAISQPSTGGAGRF